MRHFKNLNSLTVVFKKSVLYLAACFLILILSAPSPFAQELKEEFYLGGDANNDDAANLSDVVYPQFSFSRRTGSGMRMGG